jgi:hypothetical protein
VTQRLLRRHKDGKRGKKQGSTQGAIRRERGFGTVGTGRAVDA